MQPTVFTIFTGDDKTMNLKAVYEENGDPLDLTGCDEIDIALPNADGTFKHLLLTLGDVVIVTPVLLGKFMATIGSAASALFKVGELQNFDVTFTISDKEFTVRYYNCLTVLQR